MVKTFKYELDMGYLFSFGPVFKQWLENWTIIVQPKEMLLSFSIGTVLTNYDVKDRKLYTLIYSIVQKRTI